MAKIATSGEFNRYNQLLLEERNEEALKEIKRLYNLYPNDYLVIKELATLYLKMNKNVSEALFLLHQASNQNNIDSINYEIGTYYVSIGDFFKAEDYYCKINEEDDKTYCLKLYGLLKVYIQLEEYDKALSICKSLRDYVDSGVFNMEHFRNARAFVYQKLGIFKSEYNNDSYFTMQLTNYSKEEAIEHIKEHLVKTEFEELLDRLIQCIFNYEKGVHSVFKSGTNIEELYDYCLNTIQNKDPDTYGFIDYYRITMDDIIGTTYLGVPTKTIEIITFPNSKQILSIYPTNKDHINKKVAFLEFDRHGTKKSKSDYTKKLKKKKKY